jgi:hypothetical protein
MALTRKCYSVENLERESVSAWANPTLKRAGWRKHFIL